MSVATLGLTDPTSGGLFVTTPAQTKACLVFCSSLLGQTNSPGATSAFEVASVKPSASASDRALVQTVPGRLLMQYFAPRTLMGIPRPPPASLYVGRRRSTENLKPMTVGQSASHDFQVSASNPGGALDGLLIQHRCPLGPLLRGVSTPVSHLVGGFQLRMSVTGERASSLMMLMRKL
jgi:hypothetical protein